MQVEIELLCGHGHLARLLADWHHAEWGHLYDPAVWNHAAAVREFEEMAADAGADLTWVAFDGAGRAEVDVLGSVSLVADDDLDGWEHVSPWLASMFVRPDARGRGVAGLLTEALIVGAAERGDEYVHLFTSGQEDYWGGHGWRVVQRVDAVGHPATVMVRGTHPRAARRAVTSRWCADPDVAGAYSYLRIGGSPAHRERLTTEVLPGMWFAGEATSVAYPATMHGAWFSGERAAEQVVAAGIVGPVIVVGAGIAGMVTARRLGDAGVDAVVLESKQRPGGRIATDTSLGVPVPLGGAWLHGEVGHPMAPLVSWVAEEWTNRATFVAGYGRLSDHEVEQMEHAYRTVHDAYGAAARTRSVAEVAATTLDSLDLAPPVRAGVEAWLEAECESLYAAPMGDIAANGGFEEYELPGDDRLITSSLQPVIDQLAAGLDVRCDHGVSALTLADGRWRTDTGVAGSAVIVTIPIGALRTGRIAFDPPLPAEVMEAIEHIGAGPVTKVFATYDSAWWPPDRPMRLAGQPHLTALTDMTGLTGVPTLVGFAVGDAARRIEQLDEDGVCRLLDRVIADTGLRDWDA